MKPNREEIEYFERERKHSLKGYSQYMLLADEFTAKAKSARKKAEQCHQDAIWWENKIKDATNPYAG